MNTAICSKDEFRYHDIYISAGTSQGSASGSHYEALVTEFGRAAYHGKPQEKQACMDVVTHSSDRNLAEGIVDAQSLMECAYEQHEHLSAMTSRVLQYRYVPCSCSSISVQRKCTHPYVYSHIQKPACVSAECIVLYKYRHSSMRCTHAGKSVFGIV